MKKTGIRAAYIMTAVCLAVAVVLICILTGVVDGASGRTVFEFRADSSGNSGFSHEKVIYTEDDATYAIFSGKITIDGTAEISVLSYDGNALYSETYTAVTSKKINVEVNDLTPQTYYILRFSSCDATKGHLFLATEQALVERPEIPELPGQERPERTAPNRN